MSIAASRAPRRWAGVLAIAACVGGSVVEAACLPGVYGHGDPAQRVVVVPAPTIPAPGQRYLFVDGRRGSTLEPGALAVCDGERVAVRSGDGAPDVWPRVPMIETATEFRSAGTRLVGRLIEPDGPQSRHRPLVVMVHGSERTAAIGNPYAYALAAQGVAVFVYDKRGTGGSQGEYTQNFELLADDAAAAFRHATALARGRHGRAGYFGGSQGGWVAPLAASRTSPDFVVVAFGLVASPIDEDREQMLLEAREARLDAQALDDIKRLSSATAAIVVSHFTRGFERLDALRRSLREKPWAAKIKGEYSGDMLRMSDADLRRIGRARFDNLELIWNYDAGAALRRLDAPLLWILAAEDREAPVGTTRDALLGLTTRHRRVDVYQFPQTDHGMFEFVTDADGSRRYTRITEGYLQLIADWMHGAASGRYGRGERLR